MTGEFKTYLLILVMQDQHNILNQKHARIQKIFQGGGGPKDICVCQGGSKAYFR